MRILAFETSAKSVSVALQEGEKLLGEYYQNSGQTHSRTLMQMAEDLLRNCDLTPADVDAVAAAAGPGSFTGVRIGVSAAKGFAWGRELPCFGISTLEAMAVPFRYLNGIVCTCMDARRSQVYNALFRAENGTLHRLTEDRAVAIELLEADLQALPGTKFLIGDGASLCYNTLDQQKNQLVLVPEASVMQRASGVAWLASQAYLRGERPAGDALVPNYLRLSQAEREKQERMKKQEVTE